MTQITELSIADRQALLAKTRSDYDAFRAQGRKLDMTRGNPRPSSSIFRTACSLCRAMATITRRAAKTRAITAACRASSKRGSLCAGAWRGGDRVIVGDNSSLAMMHDLIVWALLKGVPGSSAPWSKEGSIAFLCPVPGYDRHFAILEEYGIRAIPVPLTGQGPDMDVVEKYAADPAVKGIWWCRNMQIRRAKSIRSRPPSV